MRLGGGLEMRFWGRLAWVAWVWLSFALLSTGVAGANSSLILPYPPTFGVIPASTYDAEGNLVGDAMLVMERLEDGRIRMRVESGTDDGARNIVQADFVEVQDRSGLRVIQEMSRSFDPSGKPLGLMRIDHERGEASCTPPGDSVESTQRVQLPVDDRVTNVPMNLLFLPLVKGTVDKVEFQFFLCRGGPRLMDFVAVVSERSAQGSPHDIVEVRFGPDLGTVVSWFASAVVPKLSFWFDANTDGDYLAHRLPLYSQGPEVTVVRKGLSPGMLAKP
jgi:hypothetical protein